MKIDSNSLTALSINAVSFRLTRALESSMPHARVQRRMFCPRPLAFPALQAKGDSAT